jgi:hypothetical protein
MERARTHGFIERGASRARDLLRWTGFVILSTTLTGCTMYRYQPVEQRDIDDLAEDGCKKGDRVSTRAELNQVYEDSLVLWNGRDPDSTFTVRFKGPGVARRTKSLVGQSRYERAYEALQDVREDERPIEVTFACRGERKTPIVTRFSFRDEGGEEIAFEF